MGCSLKHFKACVLKWTFLKRFMHFLKISEHDTVCFRTCVKGWVANAAETLSALSHRSVLTQFGQVE